MGVTFSNSFKKTGAQTQAPHTKSVRRPQMLFSQSMNGERIKKKCRKSGFAPWNDASSPLASHAPV
jgi:hypothetical protein